MGTVLGIFGQTQVRISINSSRISVVSFKFHLDHFLETSSYRESTLFSVSRGNVWFDDIMSRMYVHVIIFLNSTFY